MLTMVLDLFAGPCRSAMIYDQWVMPVSDQFLRVTDEKPTSSAVILTL